MKQKLLFILTALVVCLLPSCKEKRNENEPDSSSTSKSIVGDWKWTNETGYWILHLSEEEGGSGTVDVYDSERKSDEQFLTHDIMYEYNDDKKEAIGWLWDDSHYEKHTYKVQWFGLDKFCLVEDPDTIYEKTLGPFVRIK